MHTTNMSVHFAEAAKHELEHRSKMTPFERSILELTLKGHLEDRYRRLKKEEGKMYCHSFVSKLGYEWCRQIIQPGERIGFFYADYSGWSEEEKMTPEQDWEMIPNCLDCEIRDIARQFEEDHGWLVHSPFCYNDYVREMTAVLSGYVSVESLFEGIADQKGWMEDPLSDAAVRLLKIGTLTKVHMHYYPDSPHCFEEAGEEESMGSVVYRKLKEGKKNALAKLAAEVSEYSSAESAGELRMLRSFLFHGGASKEGIEIIDGILQSIEENAR